MGRWESRGAPQVQSEYSYNGMRMTRNQSERTVVIEMLDGFYKSYIQHGRRVVNRGFWKDAWDENHHYQNGSFKWRSLDGIILPFDINDDNILMVFKVVLDDIGTIAGLPLLTMRQVMDMAQKLEKNNVVSISYTSGSPAISCDDSEFKRALGWATSKGSTMDSCKFGN